jgi:hypothetical protein
LDKVADILEGEGWRVGTRHINFWEDPLSDRCDVLSTVKTILGLLCWRVGCDAILASEWSLCLGVLNTCFPLAASLLPWNSGANLTISFLASAGINFDGADGHDCICTAREVADNTNLGELDVVCRVWHTHKHFLYSDVVRNIGARLSCDMETDAGDFRHKHLVGADSETRILDEVTNLKGNHAERIRGIKGLASATVRAQAFLSISRIWNAHRKARERGYTGAAGICHPHGRRFHLRAKQAIGVVDAHFHAARYLETSILVDGRNVSLASLKRKSLSDLDLASKYRTVDNIANDSGFKATSTCATEILEGRKYSRERNDEVLGYFDVESVDLYRTTSVELGACAAAGRSQILIRLFMLRSSPIKATDHGKWYNAWDLSISQRRK